jgi:phage gp45-like
MIRGIVNSVIEGLIKILSASGRSGETFTSREYFQHYGFTSRPLAGAEVIIINEGNHYIGIASDDRRYRLHVEDGEVALYTDEGDFVHMKRGNNMEVTCLNKLKATVTNEIEAITKAVKVNASVSCEVTTPAATVNAATSCIINSPSVLLGGSFGTMRLIMDERLIAWLLDHTHGGGAKPDQALLAANVCTSITKAG